MDFWMGIYAMDFFNGIFWYITIWLMTNIAMENPVNKWSFLGWENHLFLWAIYTMAMLNNQRVYPIKPAFCWLNPIKPPLNHH